MIASISGTLVSKTADRVVIATAGGVSYEVAVPLGVFERLPTAGADIALRTVLVVREDGWALYGFDEEQEREIFQQLLGASGVGPRLALAILSTLGGPRVARAIKEGDLAALSTVPGIGKKTAERLVFDLKDRVAVATPGAKPGLAAPAEQAVQALVSLGYVAADADRAVRAVVSENGAGETVDLIRGALQLLTKSR